MPPSLFMARAMVSCASGLIEPKLIAPVTNLRTMESTLSTSAIGTALAGLNLNSPRRVHRWRDWSLM